MLLAKAKGMRKRLGDTSALMARLTTIGKSRATVPVLLTKPPMADVTSITNMKSRISLFPASVRIRELIFLASPVWNIAPPTTKSPIIIITTEFEKPDNASSGVRMPKSTNAMSAHSATTSERTFPFTKNMTESSRIIVVIITELLNYVWFNKNHYHNI
jgi:hypothetical protein